MTTDPTAAAAAAGYATLSDPRALTVDPAAARLLLHDGQAVGVAVGGGVLSVLLDSIPTPARVYELECAAGMPVTVSVTTPEILAHLRNAITTIPASSPVSVLGGVLAEAASRAASDVLLSVGQRPAVQVSGSWHTCTDFPVVTQEDVASARTWLAGTTQGPVAVSVGSSRWRTLSDLTATGPALVMRRLPEHPVRADEIGVPAALLAAANAPHGLIVLAGPHGQGKTTTLAAVVQEINATQAVHIACIGAPLEYVHRPMRAVLTSYQVGHDVPDVAAGICRAAQLGADVIAAELGAAQDVREALMAASTGHLVIATTAGVGVTSAVRHLAAVLPAAERGWALETLAGSLRVAAAQQLVPTTAGGVGAVFEVLTANDTIRTVLRGDLAQLPAALEGQPSEDACSMERALALNVASGRIGAEPARAAAYSPVLFDLHLAAVGTTPAPLAAAQYGSTAKRLRSERKVATAVPERPPAAATSPIGARAAAPAPVTGSPASAGAGDVTPRRQSAPQVTPSPAGTSPAAPPTTYPTRATLRAQSRPTD